MPSEYDSWDDAALAALAGAGEERAFSALFERYYPRIRAFAYRTSLDAGAADDIAQETFIRAARHSAELRDGKALRGWLFHIAANLVKDYHRAAGSRRRAAENFHERFEGDVGWKEDGDASESVRQALLKLSPAQREAVVLVYYDEVSHAEAARVLGCAESTISWRLFLARKALRKMLKS